MDRRTPQDRAGHPAQHSRLRRRLQLPINGGPRPPMPPERLRARRRRPSVHQRHRPPLHAGPRAHRRVRHDGALRRCDAAAQPARLPSQDASTHAEGGGPAGGAAPHRLAAEGALRRHGHHSGARGARGAAVRPRHEPIGAARIQHHPLLRVDADAIGEAHAPVPHADPMAAHEQRVHQGR
jgi:hypothetical protein